MFNRMALIGFCLLLIAFESRGEGLPAVVGSINIGKRPSSAVLDEKGKRLYAITESDTLEVVDLKSMTAVKSVRLNAVLDRNMGGNALSFNPTNGRLYFPGDRGADVTVYGTKSGKVLKRIAGERGRRGYSTAVLLNKQDGSFVKVDSSGHVSVYDSNNVLKEEFPIDITGHSFFALSSDGERLYVMHGRDLLTVNMRDKKVEKRVPELEAEIVPFADPATGNVFAAGPTAVHMVDIDGRVSRVTLKVSAATRAAPAVNPKTGHLFVPLADGSLDIFKVSAEGMKEAGNIQVGANPKVVLVDQDEGMVYVTTADGIAVIQDTAD